MDQKLLGSPLFGVKELQNPELAAALTEKIKGSISGLINEEYWQPIVEKTLNELFVFRIKIRRNDRTVHQQVKVPYEPEQTIEFTSFQEWLRWKEVSIYRTVDYHYLDYVKNERGQDIIFDENRKALGPSIPMSDTVNYLITERTPSRFYQIIRAEADRQSEITLKQVVQEYFQPKQNATSGWDPMTGQFPVEPTARLREAVEAQLPELMKSVASTLLATQIRQFLTMLQNQANESRF